MIVPKFVSCFGFKSNFYLSFSSYLYQVRGRHCEKRARRSYLQLNMKLDLDGLTQARYPRITKRATKRVSVLSLCCEQRKETFVNLGLFQTNTN